LIALTGHWLNPNLNLNTSKMEKEDKDIFFVEIKGSHDVRRNVLESLKDIVENLQRFEHFKNIREEKVKRINRLRVLIKDLHKLVSDLKHPLPESKLKVLKQRKSGVSKTKKPKTVKKAIPQEAQKPQKKKANSELEKLESELSQIESKLSSLG
jgi:hypothetical protein